MMVQVVLGCRPPLGVSVPGLPQVSVAHQHRQPCARRRRWSWSGARPEQAFSWQQLHHRRTQVRQLTSAIRIFLDLEIPKVHVQKLLLWPCLFQIRVGGLQRSLVVGSRSCDPRSSILSSHPCANPPTALPRHGCPSLSPTSNSIWLKHQQKFWAWIGETLLQTCDPSKFRRTCCSCVTVVAIPVRVRDSIHCLFDRFCKISTNLCKFDSDSDSAAMW